MAPADSQPDRPQSDGSDRADPAPVVVRAGDPALEAMVRRALDVFDDPIRIVRSAMPGSLLLAEGPEGLELRELDAPPGRGVRCDWGWLVAAIRHGASLRSQPLAKALGRAVRVVDATAGLGDDAMLMAALGCTVVAFERHPAIWALLNDAIVRAVAGDKALGEIARRVEVLSGDAIDDLAAMAPPDAVVIDPMYPPRRRRSALPRKAMQSLRRVVGDDRDAEALLDAALRVALDRVVVKRLDDGPPLREPADFTIEGRTVRWDVYRGRGGAA